MYKNMFLLVLFVVALVSCQSNKEHYVIAVSSCSSDMWREKLNEELTVSTYLYDNVELRIQSANDDDKRQIEQINGFVDDGIDLLIVSPNQLKTISSAIDRAYEKGIPVVLFDRKTDTDKYTAYIGADNFKVGRDMGEYVAKLMKGRGRLVVVKGLKGSSAAIERDKGFMSVISRYEGINIVDSCYADWVYEKAVSGMASILSRTSDIDCVFAQNDRMALGARHAVEQKGIDRHIDYVGVDALPVAGGGLESVDNGDLVASYIYPTRGDLVMSLAMDILEGRQFKRENSLSGALVTKDNAHVLLLQNEELNQQRSRLYTLHDKVDLYLAQYSHQRIYATLSILIIVLMLISFAVIYRSIIVRRRLAEEAAETKLTFFTNVSHEFRTPLTLIADPVDRLLADPSINEEQSRLLRLVHKNVEIMLKLVNEILDFRKVQKGKMRIQTSRFDLSAAVEQWTDCFRPAAEHKRIELTAQTEPSIGITADKEKVEKIVFNLLSNALKFTPEGGRVTVSMRTVGNNIAISVADTGPGMTETEARHVFERFYQVNKTNGGTGIGLSLVKSFAEMHQGSASVESTPGKGSVFTVTLPFCPTAGVDATESDHDTAASSMPVSIDESSIEPSEPSAADRMTDSELLPGQKPLALIVDDSVTMRSYIASMLTETYDVTLAANGLEGLDKALKTVPDIVIADVMMPEMDGFQLCSRLKKETATSHIPVLLLTAMAMDDQRTQGYDCGADAYITKPFSSKVLIARMKNLLETRRQLKTIYCNGDVNDTKPCDADTRFMIDFNRIVTKRMADSSLSVEDVSAELSLSRVQMYRKVKALTGSTPVELIRIVRLKRAEKLLRQGSQTVSEVAYAVGFSSPSYFAKCFKEQFGRLPSE